jgi:hypothetical protein
VEKILVAQEINGLGEVGSRLTLKNPPGYALGFPRVRAILTILIVAKPSTIASG